MAKAMRIIARTTCSAPTTGSLVTQGTRQHAKDSWLHPQSTQHRLHAQPLRFHNSELHRNAVRLLTRNGDSGRVRETTSRRDGGEDVLGPQRRAECEFEDHGLTNGSRFADIVAISARCIS